MSWAHELLFGNWRNKGVALFFAVTIWFVVFQSEKQEHPASAEVSLVPENPAFMVTRVESLDPEKEAYIEFNNRVTLDFSGPRKQIEDLRQELSISPLAARLEVSHGPGDEEVEGVFRVDYTFSAEDFGFPRHGIEILQFTPESVRVTQEEVDTIELTNLDQYVTVTHWKEGHEVSTKKVDPPKLVLRGAKSVIRDVVPSINVSMGYERDRFKGNVPVKLIHPARDITKLVRVEPSEVSVEVVLTAGMETLEVDAVRVTFRLSPPDRPIKILVGNMPGGTIPVEFHGPKDRIAALEEKLREPGFSVGVPVRPFELSEGTTEATFTENDLELYGFPLIQKRPHKSRNLPGPWTYRIVVLEEEEK